MKILPSILILLFSFLGFSQEKENSIYFPQEQLIHPDCENSENPNNCLKAQISTKLVTVLNQAIKQNKITNDTLTASVVFEVDKKGKLIKGRDYTFVNDSLLRNDYIDELKTITENLPTLKVLNKKRKPYVSNHKLSYSFKVERSNNGIQLRPIEQTNNVYTGGVIEEVPQYPGCKRGDDKKARTCFQKLMQKHIAKNFKYPQDAQAQGLQGRVSIMFIIDENGDVANVRVKGPHAILEEEAIRIIKLLPKLGPGLQNGNPVKVPYAIPITFKLQ